MKFWNGYRWRQISPIEARYRAARGQLAEPEASAPVVVAPVIPQAPPVVVANSPLPRLPIVTDSMAELTDAELEMLTAPPAGT